MMNTAESRFAHILKPLRDLADTWNIDIAQELENYLEELSTLQISLDGGKSSCNFAEAALLIQGSTSLYAKKVNSLYQLVYAALSAVTNKKYEQATRGADDNTSILEDKEPEFLKLDWPKEAKNIDMNDNASEGSAAAALRRQNSGASVLSILSATRSGTVGSSDSQSFRMQQCVFDQSGALLLDTSTLFDGASFSNTARKSSAAKKMHAIAGHGPDLIVDAPAGLAVDHSPIPSDDDGGGDMSFDNMSFSDQQQRPDSPPRENTSSWSDRSSDLLAQVDQHSTSQVPRPFRRGTTFRVPECLKEGGDRRGRRKNKNTSSDTAFLCSPPQLSETLLSMVLRPTTTVSSYVFGKEFSYGHRRQKALDRKRKEEALKARMLSPVSRATPEPYGEEDNQDFGDDCYDDSDNDMFEAADFDGGDEMDAIATQEDEGALPNKIHGSYETFCAEHIEKYFKDSEKFEKSSQLTKKVAEWRDRITPILEEEETHPVFDIAEYGENIVNKISMLGGTEESLSLEGIFTGTKVYDVCRMFLATLQLANQHTVEIIPDSSVAEGTEIYRMSQVTLQKSDQQVHTTDLNQYRAPSLQEKLSASKQKSHLNQSLRDDRSPLIDLNA